jgi:hypothetical protein
VRLIDKMSFFDLSPEFRRKILAAGFKPSGFDEIKDTLDVPVDFIIEKMVEFQSNREDLNRVSCLIKGEYKIMLKIEAAVKQLSKQVEALIATNATYEQRIRQLEIESFQVTFEEELPQTAVEGEEKALELTKKLKEMEILQEKIEMLNCPLQNKPGIPAPSKSKRSVPTPSKTFTLKVVNGSTKITRKTQKDTAAALGKSSSALTNKNVGDIVEDVNGNSWIILSIKEN